MAAYDGKPDAVDYSFSRPSITGLANAGIKLASRYLSRPVGNGKNLTTTEARMLHAAGIGVLLNWEAGAYSSLGGNPNGFTDAKDAADLAAALGAPRGLTIYFSVDFDALDMHYSVIDNYFRGVHTALAGRYQVGVYGHADLIDHLHANGLAAGFWQTYAWSGGRLSANADLYQYKNGQTLAGGSVDFDKIYHPAELGAWWPAGHDPSGGTEIPLGDDMDETQAAQLQETHALVKRLSFGFDSDSATPFSERAELTHLIRSVATMDNTVLAQAKANGAAIADAATHDEAAAVLAAVAGLPAPTVDVPALAGQLSASLLAALPVDLAKQVADELHNRLQS